MQLLSRKSAFDKGVSRYFTGKPCVHGHVSERSTVNGRCVECHRESQRKQNAKYDRFAPRTKETTRGPTGRTAKTFDEISAKVARYNSNNPEIIKASRRKHYEKNKEEVNKRSKNRRHKKEKGITLEEYNRIMSLHNGVCDICGTTEPGGLHKKFNLDHCHSTGMLRGVLCMRCNTGIGKFSDRIDLLEAAIRYLTSPPRTEMFNIALTERIE